MAVSSANCRCFACRAGRPDTAPDHCPMRGAFPTFEKLCSYEASRKPAFRSGRAEALGYKPLDAAARGPRVRPANGLQADRPGHCPDVRREAVRAAQYFRELVPVLSPCMGKDSATLPAHQAPAVVPVAKDRVLAHNSVAALYEPEDRR